MLGSELASRVRVMAGDEAGLIYTSSVLLPWINDGIRECIIDNMLLQKSGTVNTLAGQTEYDLPTDILKLYSIRFDNRKLSLYTLDEFDELVSTDQSMEGTPTNAVIWAGKIRLYPVPDSTKELKIEYSYTPPAMTDLSVELYLPLSYHSRIVDWCLAKIAEQDDDMNRYQMKMDEFRSGVQSLKDHAESSHDVYPSLAVSSRDMAEGYWD